MHRELSAIVAIPIVLSAIIWAPEWVFLILLDLVILFAADELFRMAEYSGIPLQRKISLLALVTFLGAAYFKSLPAMAGLILAWALLFPVAQIFRPSAPDGSLRAAAVPLYVMLSLGAAGSSLGWLKSLAPDNTTGTKLLLLFLFTIWIGDSGAYYLGKNFGRHKMAPVLSPKKTWEGLAGGIIASFLGAAAFHLLFPLPFGWAPVLIIAAILSISAPLGDLVESVLKRDTGVKDSSNLIPGHGGLLDRTDSLFFSAPVVLAYLWFSGLYSFPF